MKPLPSADTGASSTCCADEKRKPTPMQELLRLFVRELLHFCASCGNIIRQYVHCRNMRS